MSNVSALKAAVLATLGAVPGIGTIDPAQMDPDGLPRKLRGTTPYWGLTLAAVATMPPAPADLGGGGTVRQQFFAYRLRLEGWRGFAAAQQRQDEWETLVESIVDRLLVSVGTLASQCPGLRDIVNISAEVGAVVEVRDQELNQGRGYRAHHAVILADVDFYRVLAP